MADDAIAVDDEGDAAGDEAEEFVHAVELADIAALIGEEGEAELVSRGEAGVGIGGIAADAEDDRAVRFKLGGFVTEAAGFDGSTFGVVFRVEEDDHRFAAQLAEADGAAVLIGKFEVGCGRAGS